jgi:hypothetical protein
VFVESLDDIARDETTVKLDREVAAQACYIAEKRRVPLVELLTEALRPVIARLFEDVTREGEVMVYFACTGEDGPINPASRRNNVIRRGPPSISA